MKVEIVEDDSLKGDEILIKCSKKNNKVLRIKDYAENMDFKIKAKDSNDTILVLPKDIFYIESVDKKTFVYLKENVLETESKLYELEETLSNYSFLRISKSCIANISLVEKIRIMINRNLMLTMENGEKIIVSRRYVKKFNDFIGME